MTSPTPMLAEPTSIQGAQATPAREVSSPPHRASRAGTQIRTPGVAPTTPGVRLLILHDREKAADLLERVALLHWNGQIDDQIALVVVRAITPPGSLTDRWERFEALQHALFQRNGVNDCTVDWREIDDSLTCSEPSTAAYEIACSRVDDAMAALLGGGR